MMPICAVSSRLAVQVIMPLQPSRHAVGCADALALISSIPSLALHPSILSNPAMRTLPGKIAFAYALVSMRHTESYANRRYAPAIICLRMKAIDLMSQSRRLGLLAEAKQLSRVDDHLVWLLEHKAHPRIGALAWKADDDPDGDWDDIWADDDTDIFRGHFNRHAKDFGAKDWNDYAKQSQDFYNRFRQEKLPAVRTNDGWVKVYDPESNTFGVYNPEGKTETFFQPSSPTYFEREIQDTLNKGGEIINPLPPEGVGGGGGLGGIDILHPNRNPFDLEE